jgi:hypothetical protein
VALTFGDLRTAAQSTDFAAVSIVVVDRALNDAIQDILRKASVPAREVSTTITTVAGTATYSLPAATERILSVLGADGTELDQIDRQDVDPIAVGDPSAFALYGADVIFSPVPAAAATYTVLYTGLPTADLVSANVVSTMTGIPDNYAQGRGLLRPLAPVRPGGRRRDERLLACGVRARPACPARGSRDAARGTPQARAGNAAVRGSPVVFPDFSGGLNLVADPADLALNESFDALNVRAHPGRVSLPARPREPDGRDLRRSGRLPLRGRHLPVRGRVRAP